MTYDFTWIRDRLKGHHMLEWRHEMNDQVIRLSIWLNRIDRNQVAVAVILGQFGWFTITNSLDLDPSGAWGLL